MRKSTLALVLTVAILLTAAVSLTACTIDTPTPAAPTPTPVSAPTPTPEAAPAPRATPKPYRVDERFINDYNTLWSILENDYPFFGVAERVTGSDFAAVKEKYREKLQIPHRINTPKDFFTNIVQPCLWEFDYAGHLTAISQQEYTERYKRYQRFLGDGGLDPKGENAWEQYNLPKVREFYGGTVSQESSAAPDKAAAPTSNTASAVSNLSFQDFPEEKTAYVSIKAMTLPFDNDDEDKLKAFFERIEKSGFQHCIIDIRKNGGGSDMYWRHNIVAPNLTENRPYSNYALIQGERCREYVAGSGLDWYSIYPIEDMKTDNLPRLSAEDYRNADYYAICNKTTGTMSGHNESDPYNPVFKGDFWLLVGPRVYSSSEMFANFCKETGFAKLVGATTGGDGLGIDPMIVSLPETGICIQFSSLNGLNPDGSSNEEFGTEPDIVIAEGEDALTRCLQEISRTTAKAD